MGTLGEISASKILHLLQISIPIEDLRVQFLDRILSLRINPEIVINHTALERLTSKDYQDLARQLNSAGLRTTIHAPFLDLRPGALDPIIREVSFARLCHCLEVSAVFNPIAIVCHHAFDEKYYTNKTSEWEENSIAFWSRLIPFLPQGSRIAIENVYEKNPEGIKHLLETINSEKLRFCFDIGHCNCFAGCNYEEWMDKLSSYLTDIHLHNNYGNSDEHLPPLEGTFPVENFFALLRKKGLKSRMTIEAHSIRRAARSLQNLEKIDIDDIALTENSPRL
ncbi:MAG: sugar phosphate isomerase/epimerase [Deltaproteobacteria bacterium]|nr:sugar phosphate isomerase/epimerase [Deltaproteobacteria bacterium]